MATKRYDYLKIHLAVLLFGGAGLFGKLIHISSGGIVLGRAGLAAIFLIVLKKILKEDFTVKTGKDWQMFALLGTVLAFHWIAFFESIQLSSVAIGVLTFSTFPIFTTLLEPLINKEKMELSNLALALVALVGVALVMPSMTFEHKDTQGALWGIASGASFAVLTIISKNMISAYSSNSVSLFQNGIAALVLVFFFHQDILNASSTDWFYLILLGFIFTGIAHTLFISSMQNIKAQTASLIASLEPVYGILLAWLILHEVPTLRMFLGGSLILGVAFFAMFREQK